MIPLPRKDTKGKVVGDFYPLQKAELIALRKAKLINNSAFVHLALRSENPYCDRPIEIIPKEFALRWKMPESSVYEAIAKLKESNAINIKAGKIIVQWVDSQQESDSENPESILRSQNEFRDSRINSEISENESLEPLTDECSVSLQTYSDYIQTYSDSPLPPQGEGAGEIISVKCLSNDQDKHLTIAESALSGFPDLKQLSKTETIVPARENRSQIQKPSRIREIFEETGKVCNYGMEYQQWIHAEMGDVIKHYRQSARALDRSPNDISLEFKSYVALKANSSKGLPIHAVEKWIVNCEKTPDRWPELRSLVAEWLLTKQRGDRHLNIAQEIERASRPPIEINLNF